MMRRLRNNIKHHKNWPAYLAHKYFRSGKGDFTFLTRSGLRIEVPQRLLQTYKECFFDETYFKGFPRDPISIARPIVVDVGANVGYFSLALFSENPNARVLAYEPMPNNFALLKKYHEQFPELDFQVTNKAVGSERREIELSYDASDSFTTAATVFEDDRQPDRIKVRCTTLGEIFEQNGLEAVDLLKLDCEGSEYDILYGASSEVLAKIGMMAIETHNGGEEKENKTSLMEFLSSSGFQLGHLRSKIWAWT